MKLLTSIASLTIIEQFLGGGSTDIEQYEIEGEKLDKVACNMFNEVGKQRFDFLTFLFGNRFPKLGLRQQDRMVKRKLNSYFSYLTCFIKNRIHEIEESSPEKE